MSWSCFSARALTPNNTAQLCIALADIAVYMADWANPIGDMMAELGTPDLAPALLEFLSILPEEISNDSLRVEVLPNHNLCFVASHANICSVMTT